MSREGGGWHKAWVPDCLPLAVPIGLSPLLILTLCGPERVLVVSTEPLDDLSCLTTPGVGLLPVPLTGCMRGGGGVESRGAGGAPSGAHLIVVGIVQRGIDVVVADVREGLVVGDVLGERRAVPCALVENLEAATRAECTRSRRG